MSLARQFFHEMRPFFRLLDDVSLARRNPQSFLTAIPQFGEPFFNDTAGRPALDISDKGDKYIVEADLPGIPKENVQIRIGEDGQTITIEGKVEEKGNQASTTGSVEESNTAQATDTSTAAVVKPESSTQISSERPFTRSLSFARTVWLPRPADPKNVTASMNNGVLTIAVKKADDKGSIVVPID